MNILNRIFLLYAFISLPFFGNHVVANDESVPTSVMTSDGTPDGGVDEYISSNPFETMIRLGRMNASNPLYAMPGGSAGNVYVTSAVTSGDAVVYPLGYTRSSAPDKHFVIISKESSLVMRDNVFDLTVTENTDPSSQSITVYTDWNRDGVFEDTDVEPVVNASLKSFTATFNVPADAELGKTRIRVRMESSKPSSAEADVSGGRVYDFVVYVLDGGERNDCFISVSASDSELGTAVIETPANASGRYDKGTQVKVLAVVNEESQYDISFKGWQVSNEIVSEDAEYTFTVESSVHLVAVFEARKPELEAPQVSTEDAPIWYQIKNAHTAETRSNRYIAYDVNTTSEYSTALRAEKPADISDKFLWRLEDAGDGKVYLVNKGSDLQIYGKPVLETEALTCSENGSMFAVAESGNANGSYSIKFEGNEGLLLNAQDGTWKIVLYNAGIGTGSGWYFYHVYLKDDTADGIASTEDTDVSAVLNHGNFTVSGLNGESEIMAVSMTGQLLGRYTAGSPDFNGTLRYPERYVILVINDSLGEQTVLKLFDKQY